MSSWTFSLKKLRISLINLTLFIFRRFNNKKTKRCGACVVLQFENKSSPYANTSAISIHAHFHTFSKFIAGKCLSISISLLFINKYMEFKQILFEASIILALILPNVWDQHLHIRTCRFQWKFEFDRKPINGNNRQFQSISKWNWRNLLKHSDFVICLRMKRLMEYTRHCLLLI